MNDILEHHGVKGQRWGITRKGTRSSVHERRATNKASKQRAKSWETVYKNRGKLSDTDLKNSVNRLRMENELGRLAKEATKSSTSQRGKEAVSKWGSSVISSVQSQATQLAVQAAMSAAKSKIKHSNKGGSEYMIYVDDIRGETIHHHGIKGQRWGVRKRVASAGHRAAVGIHKMDETYEKRSADFSSKHKVLGKATGYLTGATGRARIAAKASKKSSKYNSKIAGKQAKITAKSNKIQTKIDKKHTNFGKAKLQKKQANLNAKSNKMDVKTAKKAAKLTKKAISQMNNKKLSSSLVVGSSAVAVTAISRSMNLNLTEQLLLGLGTAYGTRKAIDKFNE